MHQGNSYCVCGSKLCVYVSVFYSLWFSFRHTQACFHTHKTTPGAAVKSIRLVLNQVFNITSSFYFVLTWMSRRSPKRGRSLQMRTAYFTHWENVALSPSLTTSSSPLCCPVSTLLKCTDVPFQYFIRKILDNAHKSNPKISCVFSAIWFLSASVKTESEIFQYDIISQATKLFLRSVWSLLLSELMMCVYSSLGYVMLHKISLFWLEMALV